MADRSATSPVPAWRNSKRLAALLPLVPALALFAFAARLVSHARGVPDYDYWWIFSSMLTDGGLRVTPATLYVPSNEHIVLVTKLVYLANFAITGGDNLGLSLVACAYALVMALLFTRVLTRDAGSNTEAFLLGVVAATAAFSPMAAHNFFLGMSGVAWLGANIAMVGAAATLMHGLRTNSHAWLAAAFVLALAAGHTYSTGVVAMLALGLQGLSLPGARRRGAAFIAMGLVFLFVVYALQEVPSRHGSRTFDPAPVTTFALKFLGGGLMRSPSLALLWGAVGVAAFLALSLRNLRNPSANPHAAAFWIAICGYALMNAGIAAIGRAEVGGQAAAFASRYASVPSLFWIGLLGLALARHPVAAGTRVRGIVLLATLAATTAAVGGWDRVEKSLKRSEGKPMASLALWLGIRDEVYLRKHVTPVLRQLDRIIPELRAIGHSPFGREFGDCPRLGERLKPAPPGSATEIKGRIDAATPLQHGWFRVHGWALAPELDDPPLLRNTGLFVDRACLALVDERNRVIGLGFGGTKRPDVARAYQRQEAAFGWAAYAKVDSGATKSRRVRVMVRDPAGSEWIEVPSSSQIPMPTRAGGVKQ